MSFTRPTDLVTAPALSAVWCVIRRYTYEGEDLRGVFSTRELAEAYVASELAAGYTDRSDWEVREEAVDRLATPRVGES